MNNNNIQKDINNNNKVVVQFLIQSIHLNDLKICFKLIYLN